MTKSADTLGRLADTAVAELSEARSSDDAAGAAIAAATLRALAGASGLSRQTIVNICAARSTTT